MEDQNYKNLKDYIGERFENHEQLENLRHQRIDELLALHGKESESNSKTVVRIHQRVDRIEQSIKTVKGVGTFIATCLTGLAGWFGLVNNK